MREAQSCRCDYRRLLCWSLLNLLLKADRGRRSRFFYVFKIAQREVQITETDQDGRGPVPPGFTERGSFARRGGGTLIASPSSSPRRIVVTSPGNSFSFFFSSSGAKIGLERAASSFSLFSAEERELLRPSVLQPFFAGDRPEGGREEGKSEQASFLAAYPDPPPLLPSW